MGDIVQADSWDWIDIPENSALIIVDAQVGFAKPATKHVEERISTLISQRGHDFSTIIATRFENHPDSNFRKLLDWHNLGKPEETALFDAVEDSANYILEKSTYGAATRLSEILDDTGITDVFICGIDTDVCVLQNAAGLFDLGYFVRVIVDACATNGGPDAQEHAIMLLMRTIGQRQTLSSPGSGS